MAKQNIPTIEELLKQLKKDVKFKTHCLELYRQVASGERHPTEPPLPTNMVILACQAMVILLSNTDIPNA